MKAYHVFVYKRLCYCRESLLISLPISHWLILTCIGICLYLFTFWTNFMNKNGKVAFTIYSTSYLLLWI